MTLLYFSIGLISNLLVKIVEYPWKRLDFKKVDAADLIVVLSDGGKNSPPGETNIIE